VPRPPPATTPSRHLPSLLTALMVTLALVAGMVLFASVPKLERVRRTASNLPASRSTPPSATSMARPTSVAAVRNLRDDPGAAPSLPTGSGAIDATLLPGAALLELDFVSAIDGAPVVGLPIVAFREAGEPLLLARAQTDDAGTLRLAGLPAGELLVATGRSAPHAATTVGFRLTAGEARRATVAIGAGGRAVGRVVDDLGRPLPDVAIRLETRPGPAEFHDCEPLLPGLDSGAAPSAGAASVVATSDADGRFEVTALLSRAAGFAADEGGTDDRLLPTRDEPIELFAELDGRSDEATVAVAAHETARVPDLVLPRPIAFAGFVVDAHDQPVRDALVTSAWDRGFVVQLARPLGAHAAAGNADYAAWTALGADAAAEATDLTALPGEPALELRRGEALTLASGRFDLTDVEPGCQQLWVIGADGACHSFLIEELAPGTRRADLRLVLPRATGVFVALTTEDGAPWDVAAGGAVASLLRHDGTPFHAAAVATTTPGELALTSELPPEELRAIVLEPADCERLVIRLREPPAPRARIDAVVRPHAALRLELRLPDGSPAPTADRPITLHACLADAAARAASGKACCGLGEQLTLTLEPGTTAVELRLREAAPWFVTVHGPFVADERNADAGALRALEFGPFTPGGEPVVLVLPELQAVADAPPPAPGGAAPRAGVRFRVIDAVTRSAIEGAVIESCRLPQGDETGFWQGSDADGLISDELPLAADALVIRAFGYAPSAPHPLPRLVQGSTLDVGTIDLQPRTAWPVQLTFAAADGHEEFPPLAGCAALPELAASPLQWLDVESHFDGQGHAELLGELPERFVLLVGTESPHHSNRLPPWWELPVARGERGTPLDVVLPELHDVEAVVDLRSVALPLRAGNLAVAATPDRNVVGLLRPRPGAERDAGGAPERRFRFRLPAGHYTFAASGPLFRAEPLRFEVRPDCGLATVELTAR